MPEFFGYTNAIFGSQSTVNGGTPNYNFAPPTGGTWRFTGSDTYFVVKETTGASNFNGDITNETVAAQEQIGGVGEQVVDIGGTDRQIIYDYSFTISGGGETFRVTVIDVDFNNDDDLNDSGGPSGESEDGYFLIFPDGLPDPDTDYTIGGIVDNEDFVSHASLDAAIVCFADGTLIDAPDGAARVEDLKVGDMVETRDGGTLPIVWIGKTTVPAVGDLAPVVISKGTLGNTRDLTVSAQHGVLLDDWRAEMFFGQDEVLVRAIDLLNHEGVYRRTGGMVTYYHILLDAHHLLRSEGVWSESLYPGDMTLQTVNTAARDEIETLFPDLAAYGPKAVPCIRKYEASCLA